MKPQTLPLPLRLALLLMLVVTLTGCMSTEAKVKAVKTATDLKTEVVKQDEAQQKGIESLVRQNMELQREKLKAVWQVRKAEQKVLIYEATEKKSRELRDQLAREINAAISPVETRLLKEIESESGRGTAGAERTANLRLQLASTLAITQREAIKSENVIEEKLVAARNALLAETEEQFKTLPAGLDGPVTEAELEAVVGGLREAMASYREGVSKSTDSLTDYITVKKPWELFAKGLAGETLYKLFQPRIAEASAKIESVFQSGADKAAAWLAKRTPEKLNAVNTK